MSRGVLGWARQRRGHLGGHSGWSKRPVMRSDWPAGFTTASISAALDALSDVGVSTKVTVPVCGDIRFDEAEIGSVFIDCTAEARFHRSYPKLSDAISDASRVKRSLVLWLDWPIRPGVIAAGKRGDSDQRGSCAHSALSRRGPVLEMRHSLLIDGVPTIYVVTESGLFNAVRVIGRELRMSPMKRRVRGFGEAAGELVIGMLCLLPFLLLGAAAVFGFGHLLGMW